MTPRIDSDLVEMVEEFHELAGIPIRRKFARGLDSLEKRKLESLLDEEVAELKRWLISVPDPGHDRRTKVVDALGDICYVAVGAALQIGVDLNAALARHPSVAEAASGFDDEEWITCDSLAEAFWQTQGVPARPPLLRTLRAFWRSTDSGLRDDVYSHIHLLDVSVSAFKSGLRLMDADRIETALTSIVWEVFLISYRIGLHLPTAFNEIHRSNMTKIGDGGRVIRRADGKILKGEGFEPPALSDVEDSAQ